MKAKLFNTIFVPVLLLAASLNLSATNYTWVGGGSTDSSWATPNNWNPNTGTPGAGDNVTISTGTNNPYLDGNRTIANLTVSGKILDLKTFTLTATGTVTCSGGNVNNGTLLISSSTTTTFSGTVFGAVVSATSSSILLNGSTFNNNLTVIKKGSGTSTGAGSNIFNAPVVLIDSSTGDLILGNTSNKPDVFNSTLSVIATTSAGGVYLGHNALGNVFDGSVTFTGVASSFIYCSQYGSSTFNDSIIFNALSGTVRFGYSTGTCTQSSGHKMFIGPGGFSAGAVYFHNFTQSGSSDNLNLSPTGTATIYFEEGSTFNSPVNISAPRFFLHKCRFLSTSSFTLTGSNATICDGGCYFGGSATIKNNSSVDLTLANSDRDTFATTALIENIGNRIFLNGCLFLGSTTFKNSRTNTTGNVFYASRSGATVFQGNLTLEDTVATIIFGESGGTTLLDNSTMSVVSGYSGILRVSNLTQTGTYTVSIIMPDNISGAKLSLDTNNIINGPFVFSGSHITLGGTTFNNTVNITRNISSGSDNSNGGNTFNGAVTIQDSSFSNHSFRLANLYPDVFNVDVTFIEKGSNTTFIQPAYSANTTFKGNITVQGTAAVPFGANGGKVIFAGNANQTLNKSGSFGPTFKKIEVNKPAGTFKLNVPLTLTTDTFFLTKGIVITDATNILSVPSGGTIWGGRDSAYVHGPLKKTGYASFTFSLGDSSLHYSGSYHPITIGTSSSTTDSYTAQYFSTGQTSGSGIDNTMEQLSDCEYWSLARNTGTSNVTVKLGWNQNACNVFTPSDMKVAGWNGSAWKDLGNGAYTGDVSSGTVVSTSAVTAYGNFTLADNVCTTISAYASKTDVSCNGGNNGTATVTANRGTTPYTYLWSNESTPSSVSGLPAATYSVLVTDSNGCTTITSTVLTEPTELVAGIAYRIRASNNSSHDGSLKVKASDGSSPYAYSWSNGATTVAIFGLAAGTYSVVVTDAHGCTDVVVTSTNPLSITACSTDSFDVLIGNPKGGSFGTDTLIVSVALPKGIYLTNTSKTDFGVLTQFGNTDTIVGIGARDTILFTYFITAGCGSFKSSTDSLRDTVTARMNQAPDTEFIHQYSINTPWIIFDETLSRNLQINNAQNQVTFERRYYYKNTSASSIPFNGYIYWRDTLYRGLDTAALQINSVSIISSPSVVISDTTFVSDTSAWVKARVSNLTNNDSLVISEWVTLTGCPNGNNYSDAFSNLYYGCDSSTTCAKAYFPEEDSTDYQSWAYTQETIQLTMEEMNASYNKTPPPLWLCPSTDEFRVIRMIVGGNALSDSMYILMSTAFNSAINISYFRLNELHAYFELNGVKFSLPIVPVDTLFSGAVNSKYLPDTIPASFVFKLDGPFFPGDTLYLTFWEHKWCIDTVDSNFNHGVEMNNIRVIDTLYHPCSKVVASPDRPVQLFSLKQSFLNYTGLLAGGESCTIGDSTWLEVSSQTVLGVGIREKYLKDVALDTAKMLIEVRLDIKPGLFFVEDSLYLVSPDPSIDTIFSHRIDTIMLGPDIADGEIITARFHLPSNFFTANSANIYGYNSKTTSSFKKFFSNFNVRFKVAAKCCHEVGGSSGVSEKFFVIYDSTCSSLCRFPLASVSDKIAVTCPGCEVPGWNIRTMDIRRLNKGWADIDNDNHPDVLIGDTIPTDSAAFPPALNRRAMIGDTLEIKIIATSSNGNSPLMYGLIGFPFRFTWLELSQSLFSKFQFINGSGKFNASTFSVTQNMFTDVSQYRYLDLPLDSISTPGDTINTSDTLSLTMRFRIIENPNTIPYLIQESMEAKLYMSGVVRDSVDSIANTNGSNVPVSPTLRKELAYWCIAGEGRFTRIGVDFREIAIAQDEYTNNGNTQQFNACYKTLYYKSMLSLGEKNSINTVYDGTQGGWNSFPFEVHDFMRLDSISFSIPPSPSHWIIDKVNIRVENLMLDKDTNSVDYYTTRFICGVNSQPYHYNGPVNMNAGKATIYPRNYYKFLTSPTDYRKDCGNFILDKGDESKQVYVELILKSNDICDTMPVNTSGIITAYHGNMPESFSGAQKGFGGDSIVTDTIPIFFTTPHPLMELHLQPLTEPSSLSSISTTLMIHAHSPYDFNRDYCENLFVYPVYKTGNIHVTSMQYAGSTLTEDANGFFKFTNYNFPVNPLVNMQYTCNTNASVDSVLFLVGCNCYSFPVNINNVCHRDTIIYRRTSEPPGLQVTITPPDIAQSCDTVDYTLHFHTTGSGAVINVRDTILLDSNLTYLDSSAIITYQSSSIQLNPVISSDTLTWNFDTITHIRDSLGLSFSDFYLTFRLLTSCAYHGDTISINTNASRYCGSIHFIQNSPPKHFQPSPAFQHDSLRVSISSCSVDSVTFTLTVDSSTSPTTYTNGAKVILPPNYSFVTPGGGNVILPPGSSGTHSFTIYYERSDSFCTATSDKIYSLLMNGGISNCGATSCTVPPFATAKDSCVFNYNGIFTATITAGGPTTYCIGDSVQLCADNIAGASYFWNTGERTECIYAHAGGVYSVIVNAPVDCPDTAVITITVDTTCCANGVTLDPDSLLSGTYNGPHDLNHNVWTNSSLVTFNNLNLAIAPGIKITVLNGDTLRILNSHLYACGDMWRGIVIDSGGTLLTDSSLIEDAQYAILAKNGSAFRALRTTFNRDYVGIYVAPKSTGNTVLATIGSCRFTCNAPLARGYSGQSPAPLTTTFAGIFVNDLTVLNLSAPAPLKNANTFDHLNSGVCAYRSNLNIGNARFSYIDRYDAYSIVSNNAGIALMDNPSAGHSLTYKGIGKSSATPDFDHCGTGVYTMFAHTTVYNAHMTNMRSGIKSTSGVNRSINLNSNHIEASLYGISSNANNGSINTTINNNDITMTGLNSWGIRVQEFGGTNPNASLENNYIIMQSGNYGDGIAVEGASAYNVTGNYVQMNNSVTTAAHGYYFAGSNLLNAQCNRANGNSSVLGNAVSQSISTSLCNNYFYKCNDIDSTYEGLFFDGTNVGQIQSNDINTHYNGLYIDSSGVIGPQNLQGNSWHRQFYPGWGARNANTFIEPIRVEANKAWNGTNSNIPDSSDYDPSNLFQIFPGTDLNCPSQPAPYCGGSNITNSDGNDSLTEMDFLTAKDSVHSAKFDEVTVWNVRRILIEKLFSDTNLISEDTSITTFYTAHASDNIGSLSTIRLAMNKLNMIDFTTSAFIQSNLDDIAENTTAIAYNDSLIINDDSLTPEEISGLLSENEGWLGNISNSIGYNNSVYDSIHSSVNAKTDSINEVNSILSTSLMYEQNEITVNDIYLNTVAKGQLDNLSDYESDLYEIATQCPGSGGKAVFYARSLYALLNDSMIYDDNDLCNSAGEGARHANIIKQSEGAIEMRFEVFPNPTRGTIAVKFNGTADVKYSLTTLDVTGRTLSKEDIVGLTGINEHLIDLQGLSVGIYYLSIKSTEGEKVVKVILIK